MSSCKKSFIIIHNVPIFATPSEYNWLEAKHQLKTRLNSAEFMYTCGISSKVSWRSAKINATKGVTAATIIRQYLRTTFQFRVLMLVPRASQYSLVELQYRRGTGTYAATRGVCLQSAGSDAATLTLLRTVAPKFSQNTFSSGHFWPCYNCCGGTDVLASLTRLN